MSVVSSMTITPPDPSIVPAFASESKSMATLHSAALSTFADVPPGELLWYANANGLAEIAAHAASAAARLHLAPGSRVAVHPPA